MFTIHLATHKEKKALVSLRKNGQDMASIVNQDGKNKGNHMMGQSVLLDLARGIYVTRYIMGLQFASTGDEVYVYSFTGTWTADWPHIHFTQFIGRFAVYYGFTFTVYRQFTILFSRLLVGLQYSITVNKRFYFNITLHNLRISLHYIITLHIKFIWRFGVYFNVIQFIGIFAAYYHSTQTIYR